MVATTFLRDFAADSDFWTTFATANMALMLGIVLEARAARLEFDKLPEEELEELQTRWSRWRDAWNQFQNGTASDPGPPPDGDRTVAMRITKREKARVSLLMAALWSAAVGLIGSLLAISTLQFPGSLLAGCGMAVTVGGGLVAICGLLWATTSRIRAVRR